MMATLAEFAMAYSARNVCRSPGKFVRGATQKNRRAPSDGPMPIP